jgi:hypothetical protein
MASSASEGFSEHGEFSGDLVVQQPGSGLVNDARAEAHIKSNIESFLLSLPLGEVNCLMCAISWHVVDMSINQIIASTCTHLLYCA